MRLWLTVGDKLLLRPGSILEMDTEAVDGCEYRVWKNVRTK